MGMEFLKSVVLYFCISNFVSIYFFLLHPKTISTNFQLDFYRFIPVNGQGTNSSKKVKLQTNFSLLEKTKSRSKSKRNIMWPHESKPRYIKSQLWEKTSEGDKFLAARVILRVLRMNKKYT